MLTKKSEESQKMFKRSFFITYFMLIFKIKCVRIIFKELVVFVLI